MNKTRSHVFAYDVIRVVACLCVLTIHFNASFSAWSGGIFVYQNSVFPNYIFNQSVYLGDFGVSLFFLLTGAAMFHTYGEQKISLRQFYQKRFFSIYPMFWLAWFAATAVGVLVYGEMASGGPLALFASATGMDGYLLSLGYGKLAVYYKVGEWFLGCIILFYLLMPLLLMGMKKHPFFIVGICIAISALLYGKTSNIFFLRRVPEVVLGMLIDRYFHPQQGRMRILWIGGSLIGILILYCTGPKIVSVGYALELCVGISVLFFVLFLLLFQNVKNSRWLPLISWLARYSYPAFLVHHQVCDYMARRFDLSILPKEILYFNFLVYLVITALLSVLLYYVGQTVVNKKLYQ